MAAVWELSTNMAGNISRPSEALLGQWIKSAGMTGFKTCCVSNNVSETEGDVPWEEGD
jgi:hypothetical protein